MSPYNPYLFKYIINPSGKDDDDNDDDNDDKMKKGNWKDHIWLMNNHVQHTIEYFGKRTKKQS